jgi:hypothetical protein
LFAKKNWYLFCITVTRVACSQEFLLSPLSSYLHISPLGAAIKGATSFSSQEKDQVSPKRVLLGLTPTLAGENPRPFFYDENCYVFFATLVTLFYHSSQLAFAEAPFTTSQHSAPASWREKTNRQKCSRHCRINHLTSINVNIKHPSDGNVPTAGQILDASWAKIRWGLLTP